MTYFDRFISAIAAKKDSVIRVCYPKSPLSDGNIKTLSQMFALNSNICEVYQFDITQNRTSNFVIGVVVISNSEHAKSVVKQTFQHVHEASLFECTFNLHFLETSDLYENVKQTDRTLIYKR